MDVKRDRPELEWGLHIAALNPRDDLMKFNEINFANAFRGYHPSDIAFDRSINPPKEIFRHSSCAWLKDRKKFDLNEISWNNYSYAYIVTELYARNLDIRASRVPEGRNRNPPTFSWTDFLRKCDAAVALSTTGASCSTSDSLFSRFGSSSCRRITQPLRFCYDSSSVGRVGRLHREKLECIILSWGLRGIFSKCKATNR